MGRPANLTPTMFTIQFSSLLGHVTPAGQFSWCLLIFLTVLINTFQLLFFVDKMYG